MHVALYGIRVRFGALTALDGVSVDIAAGRVTAVVGENGAGKSTLMNVLFGLVSPEAGRIEIDGHEQVLSSPQHAIAAGIGMVHQHVMLQDDLTVLENVMLGAEVVGLLGIVDFETARRGLAHSLARHGIAADTLKVDLDAGVAGLAAGERQAVEILKMLWRDAELMILDEPTAALDPVEKDRLLEMLRRLRAAGKTIVIVTHRLDEVMAVADHVCVMRGGRLVSSLPLAQTSRERIAREIVGGPVPRPVRPAARTPGAPALDVRDLVVAGRSTRTGRRTGDATVGPLSFEVCRGEIVGVAGVTGNGQAELIAAVTGLAPASAGTIAITGHRVETLSVRERRRAGLAYIPQDRRRRGLALGATVADNASAGRDPRSFAWGPFLDRAAMARYARGLIADYRIRVAGPGALAATMSGGNQQKLVAAREFARATAIELIHAELMRLRDGGCAVLLVSSDLDEILQLSDRVLVMYAGTLSGPLAASQADRNRIAMLMTSRAPQGDAP
jgi:simple sugar transport system ATP-binding protein